MTNEQIIEDLEKMESTNFSHYSAPKLCTKNARERLKKLQECLDKAVKERDQFLRKLENQEEISRDLYYERGLLEAEVHHLKNQFIPTGFDKHFRPIYTRPDPSRLEIAGMVMEGLLSSNGFHMDVPKLSLAYADALIAEHQKELQK